MYLWCAWDFAAKGLGTPAPIDAPRVLVGKGLYRFTRNPMYVGVSSMIAGQAVYYGSSSILVHLLAVALAFHAFVRCYEEPTLRRLFGEPYDDYCRRMPRWLFPAAARDRGTLFLLALAVILLHSLTNAQYGFHRDELLTLNNARHLAWGYVVYPPMTPFLGRLELEFLETSLRGSGSSPLCPKDSCCSSPVSQPANLAASAKRNLWPPWRQESQGPRWFVDGSYPTHRSIIPFCAGGLLCDPSAQIR